MTDVLKGVTENTLNVLNRIKTYQELSQYFLVGGTALAIRTNARLSEDIDLFYYNQYPGKRQPLPRFKEIIRKISDDFSQIEFIDSDKKYYAKLRQKISA